MRRQWRADALPPTRVGSAEGWLRSRRADVEASGAVALDYDWCGPALANTLVHLLRPLLWSDRLPSYMRPGATALRPHMLETCLTAPPPPVMIQAQAWTYV